MGGLSRTYPKMQLVDTFGDRAVTMLRAEEGEVLHAYDDSLGYATIGVGRLIDKRKGGGISREESAYLLANDIKRTGAQLEARLPWYEDLDEVRQLVLLGMAFQMGIDGLMGFKNTLGMIQRGEYEEAAHGMMQSLWASQTPGRARRMAEMMRTGEWYGY